MQHMRILHICPTARLDHPLAPESLQYLGHRIDRCGAEQLSALDRESLTPDVVIVDACLDLSLAPRIAEALSAAGITAAIVVVLGEGGLATASAKWGVADFLLTTAGPAEVEARLRVARDRHLSAQSGGTGTGGRLGAGFSTQPWGVPGTARGLSGSGAAGARGGDGGPWNAEGEPMIVVTGTLRIDETAFTADLGGRSLDLTYREFALLKFFAMHPERVFTRDEILLAVWGVEVRQEGGAGGDAGIDECFGGGGNPAPGGGERLGDGEAGCCAAHCMGGAHDHGGYPSRDGVLF